MFSTVRITTLLHAAAIFFFACHPSVAADKGFTGMSLDDSHCVQVVAPNSPAERAHIAAGDQVVAVGGADVRRRTLKEIVDLITGPAGTKVSITILRCGKQYKCDLQRSLSEKTIQSAASAEWSKKRALVGSTLVWK